MFFSIARLISSSDFGLGYSRLGGMRSRKRLWIASWIGIVVDVVVGIVIGKGRRSIIAARNRPNAIGEP